MTIGIRHSAGADVFGSAEDRHVSGRREQPFAAAALLGADMAPLLLGIAVLGAAEVRPLAILAAVGVLALLVGANLYPGYRVHPHERLRRRAAAFAKVGLAGAACAVVLVGSWSDAALLLGFLAAAGFVQIVVTPGVQWLLARLGLWGERTVIVADPAVRAGLVDYFRENWRLGVVPVPEDGRPGVVGAAPEVALVARPLPDRETLETLRGMYATLVLLADVPDAPTLGVKLADVNGEVGLRLLGPERTASDALRRAADVVVAGLALACFAPVIAVAALLIWLVDPGPVFFRQTREGLHGRPVRIFKLRTMYQDAEERLEALLAADPAARAEWETHFKLRDDPRILPFVGTFLRSSSCDELPQLINVLTGDMRLVGPRPFPSYHLAAMPSDFRSKRASVTPGLTGLWQVSARSEADIARQRQLDEFYIDNRSLWLDLSILLRTFSAVVRRTGA